MPIFLSSIGRVGRAERMGLAISFVSNVPEKVWFHGEWCSSRGKGCTNSKLTTQGGCCIWYDEQQVSIGVFYLCKTQDKCDVLLE